MVAKSTWKSILHQATKANAANGGRAKLSLRPKRLARPGGALLVRCPALLFVRTKRHGGLRPWRVSFPFPQPITELKPLSLFSKVTTSLPFETPCKEGKRGSTSLLFSRFPPAFPSPIRLESQDKSREKGCYVISAYLATVLANSSGNRSIL